MSHNASKFAKKSATAGGAQRRFPAPAGAPPTGVDDTTCSSCDHYRDGLCGADAWSDFEPERWPDELSCSEFAVRS